MSPTSIGRVHYEIRASVCPSVACLTLLLLATQNRDEGSLANLPSSPPPLNPVLSSRRALGVSRRGPVGPRTPKSEKLKN